MNAIASNNKFCNYIKKKKAYKATTLDTEKPSQRTNLNITFYILLSIDWYTEVYLLHMELWFDCLLLYAAVGRKHFFGSFISVDSIYQC